MLIPFCIIYDCFQGTKAESSPHDRDSMVSKAVFIDFLLKVCQPILEDQLVQPIMNLDSCLRGWPNLI